MIKFLKEVYAAMLDYYVSLWRAHFERKRKRQERRALKRRSRNKLML